MMKRTDIPLLNELLDEHGWIITGVPGGALYTIGLIDKFSHPEIAVHGLSVDVSDGLLRSAVSCVAAETMLHPDRLQEDIISGYLTKIVVVHPSNFNDWFGQAYSYHRSDLVMLQLVWPDRNGRFPGDFDFDPRYSHQKVFDRRQEGYEDVDAGMPLGGEENDFE